MCAASCRRPSRRAEAGPRRTKPQHQQQRPQMLRGGQNCGCTTELGDPFKPGVAMPGAIRLRPDQEEDIPRVRDALWRNRRVMLQRPTGTGKTVLLCAITGVVTESGAQTLILQHREELIGQTSRTLVKMAVEHGVIAAKHPGRAAPVQIASIDTIARRLDIYQPGDFKLVFADEAHHAAAPSWQRMIDHFAGAYVVGCTATPERLAGKGLDHLFGELVAGRSVKEYVELGVLAPAATFAPPETPDLSGIRRRLGDFEQTALADRMSDSAIVGDAIEHYKGLSPQLPGPVYCCSVRHSQLVAEAFTAAGYAARHVDGETPAAEREATQDAPPAQGALPLPPHQTPHPRRRSRSGGAPRQRP